MAYKASWESVVQIVDEEACERTRKLAEHALWFEQHAPIDDRFKKTEVSGIIARVMQVAMLGGDCHPATPIGINLPNAEWIRDGTAVNPSRWIILLMLIIWLLWDPEWWMSLPIPTKKKCWLRIRLSGE